MIKHISPKSMQVNGSSIKPVCSLHVIALSVERATAAEHSRNVRAERQRLFYRNGNSRAVVFPSGLFQFFFLIVPLSHSLFTSFHPYSNSFASSLLVGIPSKLPFTFYVWNITAVIHVPALSPPSFILVLFIQPVFASFFAITG